LSAGLDKFVGDAEKLNQALEPLIQYALKEVPPGKRPTTPIFLFATAGMLSSLSAVLLTIYFIKSNVMLLSGYFV
jgi:hypothetical protein